MNRTLTPSRGFRAGLAVTLLALLTLLSLGLTACNKPQPAAQSPDTARFLYVINCNGRVDKLDTREKKLVSSFALSERSGAPSAVPSLADSGGQIDGCLAQRVIVDSSGTQVSLIAPKNARLDANGLQDFQALSFTLPSFTLTRAQPAGTLAEAPWLQRDATGTLQVLPDNPLLTALTAAPLDVQALKGAAKDMGGLLLQTSGDVSLLSLLVKDSTALALGLADAKTRTLTQLAELPPTTLNHVHLAPGGGYVLIELTAATAPHSRTGALRIYRINSNKPVAELTDERLRDDSSLRFAALTANGQAVYSNAAGAYHFVALGHSFGTAAVAQSPLATPAAAPAPGLVFAAE
jgi:hypothetical protein